MASHPDIQKKAQDELDNVIGDRLPTISDRDNTPYLNALIQEVLRWHPSLPMSELLADEYVFLPLTLNFIRHRSSF